MDGEHKLNILLIQDVLIKPTNAKSILSKFGQVTEINDGLDSINKFSESSYKNIEYDVVFVDLVLPRLSGIDVVKKMRRFEDKRDSNKRAVIIMVTIQGNNINPDELIAVGADKVFVKPITYEMVDEYFKEIKLI